MGHRLNPAFIFLQSRVEKDMQSNFCMRMGSTCFTFLYRVTQNSFSPKKRGGREFLSGLQQPHSCGKIPLWHQAAAQPGVFSHPEGLGLDGKEKPFIVPSSGQLFLGKLPPSLRLPSLSNTFDPVKHTQHWNNQIQHTCNTQEQPHATKSHCDWYLLPATEELPAW